MTESPALPVHSLRALDWLNFFMADIQTGFGPFIVVYLTQCKWTQADIGLILGLGTLTGLLCQVPGGVLVDASSSKRRLVTLALAGIAVSALLYAVWPRFALVALAEILHGGASVVLVPAVAAVSLGLVGHHAVGARFGRNARYASAGSSVAAVLMGAVGYLFSSHAVFLLTAVLAIPALLAVRHIRADDIDEVLARGGDKAHASGQTRLHLLVKNEGLLVFALCAALFQLANAAILPIVGGMVTARANEWATVLVAFCIVVPQIIVVVISPWVGRQAETWGRKPLLVIGFGAVPLRAALFAFTKSPYLLVSIQMLDGIAAAVFGVLYALVVADLTRGTGRFNSARGIVGVASGLGASLSTPVAGLIVDRFGTVTGFLGLAVAGLSGLALLLLSMPETGDAAQAECFSGHVEARHPARRVLGDAWPADV